MQKALFNNIRKELLSQLRTAKHCVSIAMAWFTSDELHQALIDCCKRGLRVELILLDDAINWMPYAPDFNDLIKAGGIMHIASTDVRFLHHKFCIIDDAIVITGSYNWTNFAETRNIENVLITDDAQVISLFQEEFRRLRSNIEQATSAPRKSMEELAGYGDDSIDYSLINYEMSYVAREQNRQVSLIKPTTKIEVVEHRFNPKAAYDIGILTDDNNFIKIIPYDQTLPYNNKNVIFNYRDNRQELICRLIYVREETNEAYELIKQDVIQLTGNSDIWKLTFNIIVNLSGNGLLHIEIRCIETGKAIDFTTIKKELVKYEE
jgi:hypothetical protein